MKEGETGKRGFGGRAEKKIKEGPRAEKSRNEKARRRKFG